MKTKNIIILQKWQFFCIFILSLIPIWDLFTPGLPITHDGQDHVARIANFYQNLQEGNIIPRWAANLNWGYGHPILMFLYPLPSYIASIFHFLGFSLVESTKLVFGLAFIASGLAMYLWINQFQGRWPAFAAALLYILAPYRFVDLYVRGAIGEHLAFVFPPLILYFLFKLSKQYCYWYIIGGSLSFAGLILSHNAISLMFLPIIFAYGIYLIWQAAHKKLFTIYYLLFTIILGFGLSAFFWMPAFFEGRYTLRDIVTAGEYASRFVEFKNFFYSQWSYGISGQFSVQVGIVQWLMVILSIPAIILLKKGKNPFWITGLFLFLGFWATLILMTKESKSIWETITTLQKFQFPWRFLSVTVFITAVLGGLVTFVIPKRYKIVVCCLLFAVLLFLNKDYWHAKDYLLKPENFYTNIYPSTTDTGESSPIWSVRFMEQEPASHIEVIEGTGKVKELTRESTKHTYELVAESRVRIRENTLYFPGWEVLVDGKKTSIEFQDPANRGLITFFVDKGKHIVSVKFGETKIRLLANFLTVILTVIGLGVIVIYGILKAKLWQR